MKHLFITILVGSCSVISAIRAGQESHYQRQVREQTSVSLQVKSGPSTAVIHHIIATSAPATTPAQQSAVQAATHASQK